MITQKNRSIICISLLFIFFLAVLHSAWISDDSFITLRTVLNFLHGYGPVFNIDERVQAYTHPLWFFVLSGVTWLSPFIFLNTFLISMSISCITFWLFLACVSVDFSMGIVAAIGLILSKAYIDFSTSGLENPLSHLLLLCLVLSVIHQRWRFFFFLYGLLYLTRVDLSLIAFPMAIFCMKRVVTHDHRCKVITQIIFIGALLPALWTLFSLYYYGLPFPNTAYAKLSTGISHAQYCIQGLLYLLDSLTRDPITLFMIVTGIVIGFFQDTFARSLSYGILLYLLYVIFIGGDFMSGRFLTSPLLLASVQVARLPWKKTTFYWITCGIVFLGSINIFSTLLSPMSYNVHQFKHGIADERGYYFQRYGLLNNPYRLWIIPHWIEYRPRILFQKCGGLGTASISAGPSAFIIDTCGLSDPLLSHLPQIRKNDWRIGHFHREVPQGYPESILHNQNLIVDPQLHAYYDHIRLITRGELNDPRRIKEITRFNFDQ